MSAKRTTSSSRPKSRSQAHPTHGRAKLAQLRRISEAAIARTAPDELRNLPDDFWDDAAPVLPSSKVAISLRVDADILEFFREAGPRYQSRMNAVLRSYMDRASSSAGRRKRRGTA